MHELAINIRMHVRAVLAHGPQLHNERKAVRRVESAGLLIVHERAFFALLIDAMKRARADVAVRQIEPEAPVAVNPEQLVSLLA